MFEIQNSTMNAFFSFNLFPCPQVTQITSRMGEVDANLNYLLGRLSLVTQEFNQIKDGLGNALDNIRNSFQLVQNKIEGNCRIFVQTTQNFISNTDIIPILASAVVGPGPHKINSEETVDEIPDFKLLPQRDQPAGRI